MDQTEWVNGPHKLKFEAPDIFHCYVNAPVTLEEAKVTMGILENQVTPAAGPCFFISHLYVGATGGVFTPEARKYFGTMNASWKGVILVGGSPVGRVAVNVVMRALNLLSKSPVPWRAVKTDEEMYDCLKDLRAAEQAKAAKA